MSKDVHTKNQPPVSSSQPNAAESLEDVINRLTISKFHLDAFFDFAPAVAHIKDREGRYIRVNKQFEIIFGVRNEDVAGQFPNKIHNMEIGDSIHQHDLDVVKSGKAVSREIKIEFQNDHKIHTLLVTKFPYYSDKGDIEGIGTIAIDVSEQKTIEARFRDIVDTVDGIFWEADAETFEFTYVSQQAEKLLGYPVEDWYQTGFWPDRMHPEDRHWAMQYCLDCCNQGIDNYQFEYRFIAKDGRTIWLKDLVSLSLEDGKTRWLRGVMIDISVQKQIESAIRSTEGKFRSIFNAAPIGMLLVNFKTDKITEINPAYCKLLGRTSEEIMNLGWQVLNHPEDLQKDLQQLQLFKTGQIDHYSMEKRFIRPDGSHVWGYMQVYTITGDDAEQPGAGQYLVLVEDISARKQYEEKIWTQANYDFLTGLPNRNMLQDRIAELIKNARRSNKNFAVLLIDLDGFKDINDSIGHDKGDELLIQTTKRIRNCLRESDTVARLGGDEFVVLMPDTTSQTGIETLANKITETISVPFHLEENMAYVSASIGITRFPDDGQTISDLIKNADQAMYEAKRTGRNCYQHFTSNLQSNVLQRIQLINEMHLALTEKQFVLHYQPIVNLSSGMIYKAEALVRWNHNTRGLVGPLEFIPVAEETGLIREIGEEIIQIALQQAQKWREEKQQEIQISINVSPVQFKSKLNLSDSLQSFGLPGDAINIEITENLLMTSEKATLDTLLHFRDAGIQVSLDDFGTGYSSLSYLRKFDIDYLKIDQSFIQNLHADADDLALCSSIVLMAHTLGIKVVAEGIENEDQLKLLKEMNCDYGQGYFLSKPVPVAEFETLFLGN